METKTISQVYAHGADFAEDSNKLRRLETALNNHIKKLRGKGVPVSVASYPAESEISERTVYVYVPTSFSSQPLKTQP